MEAKGRTICAWGGVLPFTPYCRHYLSVTDIRPITPRAGSTDPTPFRTELHFNAEVLLGFRYTFDAETFRLLYRAQYDWRLPSRTIDEVADSITLAIAAELKQSRSAEKLIQYNEDWCLTIDAVYRLELKQALDEIGISMNQFKRSPEFYRRQYIFDGRV